MRHFHLRRQPHEPQRVRPSAHVPSGASTANAVEPVVDAALDQAAALWTTRRIRSFLVLQPASAPRR
ncbi:hypothetical protein SAMN05216567_107174 [Variovorax sp. OK605]|jgi:hypothetical protein|uniref:hypothetical protein n=1 Tax=Variovorax sp. OK605 TaxID=1855317 RepID=UPI0008EBC786|nr:hypothetical protein [Variovorax sp. OK605]SFP58706.1 hypothetical protein SAMN05216567_107174 [Variovorax sp. OK605]